MTTLIRAVCMIRLLLKEQDFLTSTPQRWRKEQLTASMTLVPP